MTTTNNLKTKEQGRSMIEMLGVLAIIGVLSVGALSGYRMAMRQYRVNEIVDYIMRVGEGALHHGTTQKTGQIPYQWTNYCPLYVNGEEPPFGITCNPYNNTLDGRPVASLQITNFSSADIANTVCSRIGNSDSKSVRCTGGTVSGCPSTTPSQCAKFIHFKK